MAFLVAANTVMGDMLKRATARDAGLRAITVMPNWSREWLKPPSGFVAEFDVGIKKDGIGDGHGAAAASGRRKPFFQRVVTLADCCLRTLHQSVITTVL